MKKFSLGVGYCSLLCAVLVCLASQNTHAQTPVDLKLFLLVDVSGSVDATEFALQRDGYVQAFQDPSIQAAIASLPGGIAVAYGQWSGGAQQSLSINWTQLTDAASANAFAAAIAAAPRAFTGNTAPGSALNWAFPILYETNLFIANRYVVDVSGDGAQNEGANTFAASTAIHTGGFGSTVNGLAILGEAGLATWYSNNIVVPGGGQLYIAAGFNDFEQAVKTKIGQEIRGALSVTKECLVVSNEFVLVNGTVNNTGNGAIANVIVVDDRGTPADPGDDVVVFGPTVLNPGDSQFYFDSYAPAGCGLFTNTATATGIDLSHSNDVSAAASTVCEIICPTCPTCDGSTVVVDQNVTVNFNTKPPTYSGDVALLPYFTFDTNGPTADTWKAIFNVGAKALLVTSNATIKTTTVPSFSNNRQAPGIEIHSTCTLTVDPGSKILVQSENRQAGAIRIQVDGNVIVGGTVSNNVLGTRGRPGKITVGTQCGDIRIGPKGRIVTYGEDFGGSDITLASCEDGDISIEGLVDASYRASTPSTIRISAFGGSVSIVGTNFYGTEVVGGTLRTITGGVSVRSRRDPVPGAILIQAFDEINVLGNRLLSKNYPNYGAVAIKTASNGSKGGLIDARCGGAMWLIDRALDNANRYNKTALTTAQSGAGIAVSVTASINDGASNNSKAVVSTQGGPTGSGGSNVLRGLGTGISVFANAKVLADNVSGPGTVGTNILSGCTGVSIDGAAVVSPADAAGDNIGTCGTPDPLFLDCAELGIVFAEQP